MSRATSVPYRWGCRPRPEGPDSGRPFTTAVAFAIAPPLCRWPEYSSTRPDVHRASGRHPTSHRDDFIRWVHFQLVLPGLAAPPESTNVRSRHFAWCHRRLTCCRLKGDVARCLVTEPSRWPIGLRTRAEAAPTSHKHGLRHSVAGSPYAARSDEGLPKARPMFA